MGENGNRPSSTLQVFEFKPSFLLFDILLQARDKTQDIKKCLLHKGWR